MIVSKNNTFPTKFAIAIASMCDLFVPPEKESGNEALWFDLRDKLANFQKMSMSTDFEKCLVAYYGMELSEHQLEQLQYIHDNTQTWLLGEVAEHLLSALQKSTGRDAKDLSDALMENFINKKGTTKTKKSLLVQLTGLRPDDIKISEHEEVEIIDVNNQGENFNNSGEKKWQ